MASDIQNILISSISPTPYENGMLQNLQHSTLETKNYVFKYSSNFSKLKFGLLFLCESLLLNKFVALLAVELRQRQALQLVVVGGEQHELRRRAGDELHLHTLVGRSVLHHKLLHLR